MTSIDLSHEELEAARNLVDSGFHAKRSRVLTTPRSTRFGPPSKPPASRRPRRTAGCGADSATLRAPPPSTGPEVGRALSQLGTDRNEADYDEPSITTEQARDALAKAERVVDVIERAIAGGLGTAPPP